MPKKPNEDEYNFFKQKINYLESKNAKICYFDESGFSLNTTLPYAWQEIGTRLTVPKQMSKRINVSGFLSSDGKKMFSSITIGSVTSKVTIAIFDEFVSQIKEDTFVVLDNASIHTSKLFSSKIEEWQKRGLYLLYLPPYSPQLNKIELVWKNIKEQKLTPSSYQFFNALHSNIESILANNLCLIQYA